KTVVSFSMAWKASGTSVSQELVYTIDNKYRATQKIFAYINSFGAQDILMFSGDITESVEINTNTYQQYLPADYSSQNPVDAELITSDADFTEKIRIASGYLPKDEKIALKDFMRAKYRWEIINNRYVP